MWLPDLVHVHIHLSTNFNTLCHSVLSFVSSQGTTNETRASPHMYTDPALFIPEVNMINMITPLVLVIRLEGWDYNALWR